MVNVPAWDVSLAICTPAKALQLEEIRPPVPQSLSVSAPAFLMTITPTYKPLSVQAEVHVSFNLNHAALARNRIPVVWNRTTIHLDGIRQIIITCRELIGCVICLRRLPLVISGADLFNRTWNRQ